MRTNIIRPFFESIVSLLDDPSVSEICVNGSGEVWSERYGVLSKELGMRISQAHLTVGLKNIAYELGLTIDTSNPLLDARLEDGSRIAAVWPGVGVDGASLNVRKFNHDLLDLGELIRRRMLHDEDAEFLQENIVNKRNVLISGATSSGKSTLLGALSKLLPPQDRVVLIEDTAELHLASANLVRLEARKETNGTPAVTIRDLVKHSMRLRPDRIIVGEVRDAAAFDFLQALNTGHAGSMSTIHANDSRRALHRLRALASTAGESLPDRVIASSIVDAIGLVVQIKRAPDGLRYVSEMAMVEGYDSTSDDFKLQSRYVGVSPMNPYKLYPITTTKI